MAQTIKIKRSSTTSVPASLQQGELAYSSLSDTLWIGEPGTGNIIPLGGTNYTGKFPSTAGVLEANKLVLVDSNKKINEWFVDNLSMDGNTIATTNTNGNLNITPNGAGKIVLDGQSWPNVIGTNGYYLKTDNSGILEWAPVPTGSFLLSDETNTDTFNTGETLTFAGGTDIQTVVTDNKITFNFTNNTGYITNITGETLGSLLDVNIVTAGDNNLLAYDFGSSSWINQTPAQAGFANVATSGSYNDLSNKPTIGDALVTIGGANGLSGTISFNLNDTTATSGSLSNADRGSSQFIFKNIAVSGQSTIVADSNNDTLNFAAGANISITTNATNDTITIASTDTNTDVDVSVANLQTRLGQISTATTIGTGTSADFTFASDVTISGNLTVNGGVTSLSTTNIEVADNIVVLNSNVTGIPSLDAGIEVERGDSTNVSLLWNETSNSWEFTNDGTNYNKIPTSEIILDVVGAGIGDLTNISVVYDDVNNEIDYSVATATTSTLGVARFDSNTFSVTSGLVAITALDGGTF